MLDENLTASGGCHCGAVRFEVRGKPDFVGCCHCNDCRRSTGAPITIYPTFPETKVNFTTGERKRYESSPGAYRTFCSDCGTSLTYEAFWNGSVVVGVHISTLDEPERFPPDKHVFDCDRISWFDVSDNLPRFHTVPGKDKPVRHGPISKTET